MPSVGPGARGEHMARIERLHHERLTDRVSWPKRELRGTAFLSPGYAGSITGCSAPGARSIWRDYELRKIGDLISYQDDGKAAR
jgi:hypothetical protein